MGKQAARIIITIDGLSASGKSTLAKLLAKELGFMHVNTGLLYRACAWLALSNNIRPDDKTGLLSLIRAHKLEFGQSAEKGSVILVDGADCGEYLQSQEVASYTSRIAAIPELREILKKYQSGVFPGKNIVAEGRDTGTVIFPEAPVKFFVEGDPLVRATRRAKELKRELSEEELQRVTQAVAAELRERDERDSKRAVAPVKPAPDAVLIDNSKGQLADTVANMVRIVRDKIE